MEYLTSPLAYWEGYPVKSLPIHTLVQVCPILSATIIGWVKESIQQQGLTHPLLCTNIATKRLIEWYTTYSMKHNKENMCSPNTYPKTDRCIAVFGGNTRLVIAKELGYTHIDCIVLNWKNDEVKGKRIDYMYELQRKQRRAGDYLQLFPPPQCQ